MVDRGVVGVLEIDESPHAGRAAEDHARDRGLRRTGLWDVDRVPSVETFVTLPQSRSGSRGCSASTGAPPSA